MKKQMKGQTQKVIEYMREHGSITKREAFAILRIVNLSAVLSRLREEGFPIKTHGHKGKRKGEKNEGRWSLAENVTSELIGKQKEVFEYLREHGSMTIDDAVDFLNISESYFRIIIRQLREKGITINAKMEKSADGRHINKIARYSLASKSENAEVSLFEEKNKEEVKEEWRARIKNPYFENSQGELDPLTQTRGIIIATYMDVRKEMIGKQQYARQRVEMTKFWNEHADWATEYEAGWQDGYYAAMNDVVDDIERMITDYKDWVKKSEERVRQLDAQREECSEDGGEGK